MILLFCDFRCFSVLIYFRRDGRSGGVRGNRDPVGIPISPKYPSAAQPPGSVRDVRHVPDLQTRAALVRHRLLHAGVSALRVARSDRARRDRRDHADHEPRRPAPAVRTGEGFPPHRPHRGAAAGRLLRHVLSALPPAAARDALSPQ